MPSLTYLLVPTYKQNLKSLSAWLDKDGVAALLSRRLAPDMFPFSTQVRFLCFQAQEAVNRLQGNEIPPAVVGLGQEGRTFNDKDAKDTVEACKTRIQQTLDFLETLESDALDQNGSATQMLALEIPGMQFDLTREQYARDWALPQFYFHLVAAYAILRNAGVELGKADYVPHMFAYARAPPPAGATSPTEAQADK